MVISDGKMHSLEGMKMEREGPSGYSETNINLKYKFKADVVQDCANCTFSLNTKPISYEPSLKQGANSRHHSNITQREQIVSI